MAITLHLNPGGGFDMRVAMFVQALFVLLAAVALPGCELIGDIFQAGMAVGIFLVIVVVAFVVFLVGKLRRKV